MRITKNQQGFTLVELLVGMLAAAILSYAALSLYTTQHKQMLVQDEITDLQDNLRASAEILGTSIRNAGNNLPPTLVAIEAHDTNPDTIVVTYDSGVFSGIVVTNTLNNTAQALDCNSSEIPGLNSGDWLYIYDEPVNIGEFFNATSVQTIPARIQHTTPLSRIYPPGSTIQKIIRVKFFVDQPDSTRSNLMMQTYGGQPQIFAENVADLDFRYFLSNGSIVTQPIIANNIRLVEIDLLGRSSIRDEALFNQYRTRNFTLRVNVRNLSYNAH